MARAPLQPAGDARGHRHRDPVLGDPRVLSELDAFLAEAAADPNVLGVLLVGSRAHGLEDEHSDFDVYVVVEEPHSKERRGPLDIS